MYLYLSIGEKVLFDIIVNLCYSKIVTKKGGESKMQTLKVKPNGTIVLPRSIFKPQDKIAFICGGDTLILKKLIPARISEIAQRVKEKSLSLKDIVKEIHLFRKAKKARCE